MTSKNLCECCLTNARKSVQAKYCDKCSEYICKTILYRTYRIDLRYKKIWKAMMNKLERLSAEENFLPKQLRKTLDEEGFDRTDLDNED